MRPRFEEIPVSPRLNEIVNASLRQVEKEKKRMRRKKLWISCGSAVAAFAAAVIFCVSHPALAAKLPIVGSLFSSLEDEFAYAGDYSDRAQVLTPPETAVPEANPDGEESGTPKAQQESPASKEMTETSDHPYSVTDSGLTLTASEIYSDGLSVFLSLQIHSEKPFGFNYEQTETGELSRDQAGNLIPLPATVYPSGRAYIDSEEVTFDSTDLFVEQLDEHNFNGMIKTDLPASMFGTSGEHTMKISLIHFMADFCDENGVPILDSNNIADVSLQIDGAWELELPFTADSSELQIYHDLASSDDPYQITDVYVSPYQVIANYTLGTDSWGNPDDGGVACFDEHGTLLEKGNQSSLIGSDFFSLNKQKPSELHFYVIGGYEYTDDFITEPIIIDGWVGSCKTKDEETAKERAVNTLTLPLSW